MSTPKLKVGDKLWFVPNWYGEGSYEVEVRSVGRKWATVAAVASGRRDHRISLTTLRSDEGSTNPPGRAYRDRAVYEAEQAATTAWRTFRSNFPYNRPSHLTAEDIAEITARIAGPDEGGSK